MYTQTGLWKNCGWLVHFLWMDRQRKFISRAGIREPVQTALCISFRPPLRLIGACNRIQFAALPNTVRLRFQRTVTAAVHRFEECIAGRVYLIEVAAVAKDRWRAYIVRIPGVPTALMPFYGPTPADAASLLCEWLTRAHARALNAAGTV